MPAQDPADEADIRQRFDELAEAIRAADLDGVMPIYAPDIVTFDVQPPLRRVGAEGKKRNWVDVFTLFQAPLNCEFQDLTITVNDDMAFVYSLNRISGTLRNGNASSGFWVRATACLRKIDGNWLIVHDHASVPLDVESGRAVLDLEP
ncbi:MAG TPA: nuclear transport factor 2 family protein [Streptosporangiaceae bacterium]|nr:nuclear transport factor 2 family protein [Streptosporangiaceae bacterium]